MLRSVEIRGCFPGTDMHFIDFTDMPWISDMPNEVCMSPALNGGAVVLYFKGSKIHNNFSFLHGTVTYFYILIFYANTSWCSSNLSRMVIWLDVPLTAEVLNRSTPADQDTYIVYTMYPYCVPEHDLRGLRHVYTQLLCKHKLSNLALDCWTAQP